MAASLVGPSSHLPPGEGGGGGLSSPVPLLLPLREVGPEAAGPGEGAGPAGWGQRCWQGSSVCLGARKTKGSGEPGVCAQRPQPHSLEHVAVELLLPVAQELPDHLPAQALALQQEVGHPHRRVGHEAALDEVLDAFLGLPGGREMGSARRSHPSSSPSPHPLLLHRHPALPHPEPTTQGNRDGLGPAGGLGQRRSTEGAGGWGAAQKGPTPPGSVVPSVPSFQAGWRAPPSTCWPPVARAPCRHRLRTLHANSVPTPLPGVGTLATCAARQPCDLAGDSTARVVRRVC